jgi:hypothetical protein
LTAIEGRTAAIIGLAITVVRGGTAVFGRASAVSGSTTTVVSRWAGGSGRLHEV